MLVGGVGGPFCRAPGGEARGRLSSPRWVWEISLLAGMPAKGGRTGPLGSLAADLVGGRSRRVICPRRDFAILRRRPGTTGAYVGCFSTARRQVMSRTVLWRYVPLKKLIWASDTECPLGQRPRRRPEQASPRLALGLGCCARNCHAPRGSRPFCLIVASEGNQIPRCDVSY